MDKEERKSKIDWGLLIKMLQEIVSVWILGDQLLAKHPALQAAEAKYGRENIRIVLIQSDNQIQKMAYQRQKLVLLYSAMQHYAQELRTAGYIVDYIHAESYTAGLQEHIQTQQSEHIFTMASASYHGRLHQQNELEQQLGIPVNTLPNSQFLVGRYNPIPQPETDKRYVMEYFYRDMRRHFDILMDGDDPAGGEWNYDKENRKPLPKDNQPPADLYFEPDELTQEVMSKVANQNGIGSVEGFGYAVTREQALKVLDHFLETRLVDFGPYEDALTKRSHSLYHSMLSPYLNIGLLEPLEIVHVAEEKYRAGHAPINSVEGFIRQILGWREFIYWQYWRQMPEIMDKNAWQAQRPLPEFFWSAETKMACLQHALSRAIDTGYNHHIERLMIISNFCMLAGIHPRLVNDWFLALYIDAYDWVMPPNVLGMSLNADDGLTATKPYIASANYINKMGDMCGDCHFDHKLRHGEGACPFNYLYWNFILQHEKRLRENPRLGRNVLGLRHLDENERTAVQKQAQQFLDHIAPLESSNK